MHPSRSTNACCSARDKSAKETGRERSSACAKKRLRDVTSEADRDNKDNKCPRTARVDRTKWPDFRVGKYRQDDKCDQDEDRDCPKVAGCKAPNDCMKRIAYVEKKKEHPRRDDRDGSIAKHCVAAEQRGRNERKCSREPNVTRCTRFLGVCLMKHRTRGANDSTRDSAGSGDRGHQQ